MAEVSEVKTGICNVMGDGEGYVVVEEIFG
jgi:hypothetical protein